ncbi:diuretic hormone 44 [Cephus cinctus]|uniref:Diuretic hormone 44 n=1 Tax=Cephus cinctus TaxID=211228 RepID=A0AAJ7BV97_CEPCN|nr:diuretic hormone 44 [Cephus cinctus]
MILVSVLATTAIISLAESTPLSYPTYRRRELQMADRPELLLLLNQIPGLEMEPFDSNSGRDSPLLRPKRLGSLSIVNPLDVLRERYLLELARRKMRQDQWQVDANRRFLQTIGKRSSSDPEPEVTKVSEAKGRNDFNPYRDYRADKFAQDDEQHVERNTERTQDWYNNGDSPVLRDGQDDETRRMANELHLL